MTTDVVSAEAPGVRITACRRGVPHEIAVKLGLKPNPAKTPA